MFTRLITALQSVNPELTARDVEDALWLALHMGEPGVTAARTAYRPLVPATPQPPPQDETQHAGEHPGTKKPRKTPMPAKATSGLYLRSGARSGGGDAESKGFPFSSPAALTLPGALDIARALRPFMRRVPLQRKFVLNEDATAERIAEEGLWVPVLDPALTRWLEIALVIDEGASMRVWRQTIAELHLLLGRHGAFRNVKIWRLVSDADDGIVRLYGESGLHERSRHALNPLELIDPGGQRLILVVTDCVSPAWHSGAISQMLASWGRSNPVTIVQVLPQRLWVRTALGEATPVRLHVPAPGAPNTQFRVRLVRYGDDADSSTRIPLPIPVVTLEPRSLIGWARALARAEDVWIPGFLFDSPLAIALESDETDGEPAGGEELSASRPPAGRVRLFRATASPMARKLAELLAAVPVSLPIMRIIQEKLLPGSRQVHLAEVFLGGLLQELPAETSDRDDIQYEFVDGVRDQLLNSVPLDELRRVLIEVSHFVERRYGQALDFPALLDNPLSAEGISIGKESRPFALIAAQALRGYGGKYASLADRLEKQSAEAQEQSADLASGVESSPAPGTAEEIAKSAAVYTAPKKSRQILPTSVDLRPQCPPVYNGGQLGGVVANALAAALEFCLMKQHQYPVFTPSRLFMYYNERAIEGTVSSDSGSTIADGIKSVQTLGVCPEEMWPYDITRFAERPPMVCYQTALEYRIFAFKRVRRSLAELKKCLASGYPFIFGFSVYTSFQSQQVNETGHAPLPQPDEQVIGGHAALAVGYDDANQWFIALNSWGADWGMQGYFTLPYTYFTNRSLSQDFWTVRVKEATATPPREVASRAEGQADTPSQTRPFRPLPPPTGLPPYHLSLDSVLPPEQMQAILASGRLVFHIAGDTGGVKARETQQIVASKMLEDFTVSDPPARPSFFYILGDVIFYYGEAENYYAQFYEPYQSYPAPIFAIPGNHDGDLSDQSKRSLEAFVRNFCAPEPHLTAEAGNSGRNTMTQPNVYWTLDAPFVTIVGLYTNVPADGYLDNNQLTWLESELANAPTNKALIVTMHHPIYSAANNFSGSRYMRQVLDQAAQKAGRMPDAVFAGHVHNYQRFTRPLSNGEVPYIVAGTGGYWHLHLMMKEDGGKPLQTPYRLPETDVTLESYCDDRHGFLRVEITAQTLQGAYYTVPRPQESLSTPAELRDSFTLDLHAHRVSTGTARIEPVE